MQRHTGDKCPAGEGLRVHASLPGAATSIGKAWRVIGCMLGSLLFFRIEICPGQLPVRQRYYLFRLRRAWPPVSQAPGLHSPWLNPDLLSEHGITADGCYKF